jgi:N-acetyl-alpha-D-muramate 1-phosphate uridylyltransferase
MLPVVILCGGLSTRLHSLTSDKPKSMVDVLGKPFIDHQLTLLQKNGVKEVILCIGNFGYQIVYYVGDGKKWDMSIKYSDDGGTLLGTGGALQNAYSFLPNEFIVMNGDSYLDIDYTPIIQKFNEAGCPLLMTVIPASETKLPGNIGIKNKKIVIYDTIEKYPTLPYIDYGLTIMKKWLLDYFPIKFVFNLSEAYQEPILLGHVSCYLAPKIFHEIGSIEGLEETKNYIRSIL